MPDPASLTIIGAIVGTITGVAGFVLGCVNYRRLRQIKSLDLRLELRRQVLDLHTIVKGLSDLLSRSMQSRTNVRSALGTLGGGDFKTWKTSLASDMTAAGALSSDLPSASDTYKKLKPGDLEAKLVEVHVLTSTATQLRDKYREELAADDRARDHIRADSRNRARQ